MYKQSLIVLGIFLNSAEAINLTNLEAISINNYQANAEQNKPGESSEIGIDAEAFADASVQARIDTDLEVQETGSKKNQNEIWKDHFQNSEFYKKYQAHLKHRGEMKHIREANQLSLGETESEYKLLEKKYAQLQEKSQNNWKLANKLAQKVPGGAKLIGEKYPGNIQNVLINNEDESNDEDEEVQIKLTPDNLETLEHDTKYLDKVSFKEEQPEPYIVTSLHHHEIDPEPKETALIQSKTKLETKAAEVKQVKKQVKVKAEEEEEEEDPEEPQVVNIEKIEKLDTPHAKTRTTYYGKEGGKVSLTQKELDSEAKHKLEDKQAIEQFLHPYPEH